MRASLHHPSLSASRPARAARPGATLRPLRMAALPLLLAGSLACGASSEPAPIASDPVNDRVESATANDRVESDGVEPAAERALAEQPPQPGASPEAEAAPLALDRDAVAEAHRADLDRREAETRAREAELARREQELRRERELAERERAVAARERRLAEQESAARAAETRPAPVPEATAPQLEDAAERDEWSREAAVVADRDDQSVAFEADDDEPWNESWRHRSRDDDRDPRSPAETLPRAEPRADLDRLAAGAQLDLVIDDDLSSGTSRIGDTFRARVASDVYAADGALVVPAGSVVRGRVVDARPLRRIGGRATLALEFERLELATGESVEVRATLLEQGRNKKKDKAKIIGGAVAGLILGRVLGDGETAAAGAAVGAAAGTAAAISAEGREVEIPEGTELTIELEEVVTVTTRYGEPVRNR